MSNNNIISACLGALAIVLLGAIALGSFSSGQDTLIASCDRYGHIERKGTLYMCVNAKKAQELGMNR